MTDDLEYPTSEEVVAIHADIVASDPETESGVRTPKAVSSALTFVSEGYFGEVPERIHEKAAHLMRLLAAEYPFVDGNKRTALVTTDAFYAANGYTFRLRRRGPRDTQGVRHRRIGGSDGSSRQVLL